MKIYASRHAVDGKKEIWIGTAISSNITVFLEAIYCIGFLKVQAKWFLKRLKIELVLVNAENEKVLVIIKYDRLNEFNSGVIYIEFINP